jgi:hypothetical protein
MLLWKPFSFDVWLGILGRLISMIKTRRKSNKNNGRSKYHVIVIIKNSQKEST